MLAGSGRWHVPGSGFAMVTEWPPSDRGGVGEEAFLNENAGEVQVGVRHRVLRAEGKQCPERLGGLPGFTPLIAGSAFEEAADAVIVPPLPGRLDRRTLWWNFHYAALC